MKRLLAPLALLIPCLGHTLDVSAKSAIVIDAGSGKVLWSKDADTLRYPASTTKIMTGMLLLEHCKPTDVIVAPEDVTKVKEASMHLKPGEKVLARDMLYALMLRSANDGCYAVATHIAGSVQGFAKMMNDRAKELGCTHTHFDNPNGLNDPIHYTTAHDLALMGREAMKYPEFREAVRTYKYQITRSSDSRDLLMINHDKYLLKDPSADGIKTGYTVPAGHCFVGSSTRNGFRVITVVMKSDHWQLDHQSLLHWAFGEFELKDRMSAGQTVGDVPVLGGVKNQVTGILGQDADVVVPKGTAVVATKTFEPVSQLTAPVEKGQRLGEFVIRDAEGYTQRIPVVASSAVPASTLAALKTSSPRGTNVIMGAALFLGVFLMRGKSRRIAKLYGRPRTRSF
jgi:D-alanyl-D-alanine carboxypeptidase (penicillin-binding protein 5/6)